jgi:aryl-alcohol dehydrogenase-like predicted oxidoreductase
MPQIEKSQFGSTGHQSSRLIFGAAAVAVMRQEKADRVLDLLLEYGVNHIDTAASYGESELRVGHWLREHRPNFFLATKTGERTYQGARDSLHRSLERLQVDQVDLIQLHNLGDEKGWQTAHGPEGAVEALVEAREQGLTRFIGVTGHGTRIAAMHGRSLERFAFDSVLLPYTFAMLDIPEYAADVEALLATCRERGIAVQTIKAIARRRWQEEPERRFSWYEPLRDADPIARGVRYVLSNPQLFLNSTSDATLLETVLEAAAGASSGGEPTRAELEADVAAYDMQPLFVPDGPQGI